MTLTPEQQISLAGRAKSGDKKAVVSLLEFCDRDIRAIVNKTRCSRTEREDLTQVARMVVLESAIPNFDPTAGLQFRFYAAQWVRTKVQRTHNTSSSIVVHNVRTHCREDVSLNTPLDSGEGDTLLDLVESSGESPEEESIQNDSAEKVRRAVEVVVARLPVNNSTKYNQASLVRDLVRGRLLSDNPASLDSLAAQYGVVRETVRKLELLLIEKVRLLLE